MQRNIEINPLSANPTKWSNTLKQFVGNLPTNCLSVFDYFVKLVLKGLIQKKEISNEVVIFVFWNRFSGKPESWNISSSKIDQSFTWWWNLLIDDESSVKNDI